MIGFIRSTDHDVDALEEELVISIEGIESGEDYASAGLGTREVRSTTKAHFEVDLGILSWGSSTEVTEIEVIETGGDSGGDSGDECDPETQSCPEDDTDSNPDPNDDNPCAGEVDAAFEGLIAIVDNGTRLQCEPEEINAGLSAAYLEALLWESIRPIINPMPYMDAWGVGHCVDPGSDDCEPLDSAAGNLGFGFGDCLDINQPGCEPLMP